MACYRPLFAVAERTVKTTKLFMARRPEIVVVSIACVLALYFQTSRSSATKKPPLVFRQPLPHPFFVQPSPIVDFPFGNLNTVGELLEEEEEIFVMYYAPWCAKSRVVRPEFEKVAAYFREEVLLIGINCWYRHGECRRTNKFLSFPVLYYYKRGLNGYHYKGSFSADFMVAFLDRMRHPLVYINSDLQIAFHLAQSDNSVIGHFNWTSFPESEYTYQFYYAALRVIEADPTNIIPFGIVTNAKLAATLGLRTSNTVILSRMLNTTLMYPKSSNFTSSAIAAWVEASKTESIVRLHLTTGLKSVRLSKTLDQGPALLMFVPYQAVNYPNQYVSLLRELALMYRQCPRGPHVQDLVVTSHFKRWQDMNSELMERQECAKVKVSQDKRTPDTDSPHVHIPTRRCCQCLSLIPHGGCSVCRMIQGDSALASHPCILTRVDSMIPLSNESDEIGQYVSVNSCRELQPNYNPVETVSLCCGDHHRNVPQHSFHIQKRARGEEKLHLDPFVNDWLKHGKRKACRRFNLQSTHGWLQEFDSHVLGFGDSAKMWNISQMGCSSNRTLSFLVLSATESEALYRRFQKEANLTAGGAVVVNIKEEQFHVMKTGLSQHDISRLIFNHTVSELEPVLRSALAVPPMNQATPPPLQFKGRPGEGEIIRVQEITGKSFDLVVMDTDKDVVVFFYASWCTFCSTVYHIYLSLARYFQETPNLIFTRIDADQNDLPWHLTVDSYPTIIIFPAKRKDESVSFPENVQKNLPNLVLFVLLHASHDQQLDLGVKHC